MWYLHAHACIAVSILYPPYQLFLILNSYCFLSLDLSPLFISYPSSSFLHTLQALLISPFLKFHTHTHTHIQTHKHSVCNFWEICDFVLWELWWIQMRKLLLWSWWVVQLKVCFIFFIQSSGNHMSFPLSYLNLGFFITWLSIKIWSFWMENCYNVFPISDLQFLVKFCIKMLIGMFV